MKINQDTGEAVLNHFEMIEASIAEDGVDAIKSVIDGLNSVMAQLQRLKNDHTLKASQSDLREFQGIVSDSIIDLLSKDWGRLVGESYSDASYRMPELYGIRTVRVPTNPFTYIETRGE